MKINQIVSIATCVLLLGCFGCDTVYEKGEITSLNMVSTYEFVMMSKSTNNLIKPVAFAYYHNQTNAQIFADVSPNEPMWYEGNKYVEMAAYEWIHVHIRPDYKIKFNLEKQED